MNVMFTLINEARTPTEFAEAALVIQSALGHGEHMEIAGQLMMHLAYKGHALLSAISVQTNGNDDEFLAWAAAVISNAVAETMACLDDDLAEAAS